jgi:hypothetical protein
MRKPIVVYVHGSEDSMYGMGVDLGLEGEALEVFSYTGYEVKFDCEVDTKTGVVYALAVDGTKLEKPTRI